MNALHLILVSTGGIYDIEVYPSEMLETEQLSGKRMTSNAWRIDRPDNFWTFDRLQSVIKV